MTSKEMRAAILEVIGYSAEDCGSENAERKVQMKHNRGLRHEKLAKEDDRIDMKFTLIPAGEFMMGSKDGNDSEKPLHRVTIDKPFNLGTYPVTQREWISVMGNNPSSFKGDDLPVVCVSWNDVQEFIKKLNKKEGTGKYRLPSESEWEYACRAGTTTEYYFGDNESKLGEYAWYDDNSDERPHPVGQKKTNPWGLYDMHGNIWEWVQDDFHSNYDGAPSDGSVWEIEDIHSTRSVEYDCQIIRGGGWEGCAKICKSAVRDLMDSDEDELDLFDNELGFRLLREM